MKGKHNKPKMKPKAGNAYLVRQDKAHTIRLDKELRTHAQIAADAAAIAVNEEFHIGPGRIEAFHNTFTRVYVEILTEMQAEPELAYARIDRRLQPIFGDKFEPSSVRYGPLKDDMHPRGR